MFNFKMKLFIFFLTILSAFIINSCAESAATAPVVKTYYITAKIGTTNFDADNITASYKSGTFLINGIDIGLQQNLITITGLVPSAQNFIIGPIGGLNIVTGNVTITNLGSPTSYNSKNGTLSISKIDSVGATGTFSFTTDSTNVNVTEGKFNVKF